MDKAYVEIVRLLLTVAPEVFRGGVFAMKGGTTLNLFVHDMPRLSVDIDLAYPTWTTPRDEALRAIADELAGITQRLADLPNRLTARQRAFLIGLARAEPDWSLVTCPHAGELPAIRWRLQNLEHFKEKRSDEFERQLKALEEAVGG